MTRIWFFFVLLCAAAASSPAQEPAAPAPHSTARVSAAAVWNPSADTIAAIRQKCGEADATHIERCFLNEMKAAGASAEAMAFSESLAGSLGVVYLRELRRGEKVDVAYIEYAFRANELEGVLLVNGNPSPIDVDDDRFTVDGDLRKNAGYAALAAQYPNISVWPGDRFDTKSPMVTSTGWGTQVFMVPYLLRDGCHACAEIGTLTLGFTFDTQGNFQAARVAKVAAADAPKAAEIAPTAGGFDVAGGVDELHVLAGKQFSITLNANRTTGYSWRLAAPLDPALLKQIGNDYHEAEGGAVGAPGQEVWTFEAVGQGVVALTFEYARPFEKDAKPIKTAKYSVVIE
jgi:predicted secreted protein